jgi:hypothetical protein
MGKTVDFGRQQCEWLWSDSNCKHMLTFILWQITGEETHYEFKRSWLLPVLRENACSSQIKFFLTYFLPLATVCR